MGSVVLMRQGGVIPQKPPKREAISRQSGVVVVYRKRRSPRDSTSLTIRSASTFVVKKREMWYIAKISHLG